MAETVIVNPNTGACTVNIAGLGVKDVKTREGLDPVAGSLGGRTMLRFDLGNDWFELIPRVPLTQVRVSDTTTVNSTETLETAVGLDAVDLLDGKTYQVMMALSFRAHNLGESIDISITSSVNTGSTLSGSVLSNTGISNTWEKRVVPGIVFTPTIDNVNSRIIISGLWTVSFDQTISIKFAQGGPTGGSNAQMLSGSKIVFTQLD